MALFSLLEYVDSKKFHIAIEHLVEDILRSIGIAICTGSSSQNQRHNTPSVTSLTINAPRPDLSMEDIKTQYQKKILSLNYISNIPLLMRQLLRLEESHKNINPNAPTRYFINLIGQMVLMPNHVNETMPLQYNKNRDLSHLDTPSSSFIHMAVLQFFKTCELSLRVRILQRLLGKIRSNQITNIAITTLMNDMLDIVNSAIELFYGHIVPMTVGFLYSTQVTLYFPWNFLIGKCIELVHRTIKADQGKSINVMQGFNTALQHLQLWHTNSTRETLGLFVADIETQLINCINKEIQCLWAFCDQDTTIRTAIINYSHHLIEELKILRGSQYRTNIVFLETFKNKYLYSPSDTMMTKQHQNLNKEQSERESKLFSGIDSQAQQISLVANCPSVTGTNTTMYNASVAPGYPTTNPGLNYPMQTQSNPYLPATSQGQGTGFYPQHNPQMYGPQVNIPTSIPQQGVPTMYGLFPMQQQQSQNPNTAGLIHYGTSIQPNPNTYTGLNTNPATNLNVYPNPQMSMVNPPITTGQPMMMNPSSSGQPVVYPAPYTGQALIR